MAETTFSEITIRLKTTSEQLDGEPAAKMDAATSIIEDAVEAVLRGHIPDLATAGLKPYMDEGWGDREVKE